MKVQPLKDLVEYAMHCSQRSLQEYMLRKMNDAANLEKQIREIEDKLAELRAASLLAEYLLHHGEELLCAGKTELSIAAPILFREGKLSEDAARAVYAGPRSINNAADSRNRNTA